MSVSEISLGCWTIGGRSWDNGVSTGYAGVNENDAVEALTYARDSGVNHFDTADSYGAGLSERLIGRAFAGAGDVILSSKVGNMCVSAEHPYTPMNIRHQCEQSLENLKRDYIDIYYFHHPYFGENEMYLEGAVRTMNSLKAEGKIRYIGLSAYADADFERLCPVIKTDIIQAEGSMIRPRFIQKGGAAERIGMPLTASSPLAMGLLTGRYSPGKNYNFINGDHRREDARFSNSYISLMDKRLAKIKERFGESKEELVRVALQYVLSHETVCCVLPGFRNKNQVQDSIAASDRPLSREDVVFIEKTFSEEA